MVNDLDVNKIEKISEYKRVEAAMYDLMLNIAKRKEEIRRLEENIENQKKRMAELKEILESMGVTVPT